MCAARKTARRHFLKGSYGAALFAASALKAQGANDRLGVGVIGCGGRGNAHLHFYKRLKDQGTAVEIVAVCDIYRPRLERAARRYGGKPYMDHRELLQDPRVDAVSIATPDHIHGYQVIDAVRAKKDVYCEKPFTHWRQFELTKRVVKEVKESGCVFQLGTQGMSDGAWQQAAALIKEGAIGKPIHVECGYFRVGDWGERGMPIDDPNAKPGRDLNWEAFLGDSPKRPFDVSRFFRWRMYEDYAGGPVTDLYPHSLTPVAFMVSAGFPSKVTALGGKYRYDGEREVPDTFDLIAQYKQGMDIMVLGTQANDYFATGARGAGGRCPVIRGWKGTITFEGKEIWVRPLGNRGPIKKVPITGEQSTLRHFADFVQCCFTRKKPRSHIDLAFHVQTTLQMAMLGYRAEKTARFDSEKLEILV